MCKERLVNNLWLHLIMLFNGPVRDIREARYGLKNQVIDNCTLEQGGGIVFSNAFLDLAPGLRRMRVSGMASPHDHPFLAAWGSGRCGGQCVEHDFLPTPTAYRFLARRGRVYFH